MTECPTCGGSGVVDDQPIVVHGGIVKPGQQFRFKQNRGVGSFLVVAVKGNRITLRGFWSKTNKTISASTLRSDYERLNA